MPFEMGMNTFTLQMRKQRYAFLKEHCHGKHNTNTYLMPLLLLVITRSYCPLQITAAKGQHHRRPEMM